MDLFTSSVDLKKPLAEKLRPQSIDELVLEENSEIESVYRTWKKGFYSNYLIYGPAGSGKTSFARMLFDSFKGEKEVINAVDVSLSDLRKVIKSADATFNMTGRGALLLLDEAHRLKAPQQDILLPALESGALILISATTENPGFSFNRAFLSRLKVIQTEPLSAEGLKKLLEKGLSHLEVTACDQLVDSLVKNSAGDGRKLLNTLSSLKSLYLDSGGRLNLKASLKHLKLDVKAASKSLKVDALSALIKSMRASDERASIYYLGLLLEAHEDPQVLLRRMMVFASEDIGSANSQAVVFINAVWESFLKVGLPEGLYSLYHACSYLARSPKSRRHVEQKQWAEKTVGGKFEGITFPKHFARFSKPPEKGASNLPDHLSEK